MQKRGGGYVADPQVKLGCSARVFWDDRLIELLLLLQQHWNPDDITNCQS